jgi:ubiquinone/menaquinone biosynthesis C-methylase UbiE
MEGASRDIDKIKKSYDKGAGTYDDWSATLEGAIGNHVDWELLKKYLPESRDAKILDAAGGTGRMSIPLAEMGYHVTLCDISLEMLAHARPKLKKFGVEDRIEILECDVCNLEFSDEQFDFSLNWGGPFESVKEIVRVTKRGGILSLSLVNRHRAAIDLFPDNPKQALDLLSSRSDYVSYHEEKHRVVDEEEANRLLTAEGIKILEMYSLYGWMEMLGIPEKILQSNEWDEQYFQYLVKLVTKMSREPSLRGLSRHLTVFGERV